MTARGALTGAAAVFALSVSAGATTISTPVTASGIAYVTGGIGREEVAAMKAEAKHYSLNLVFSAGPDGAFVADVNVTIKEKSGHVVLDSVTSGPMMLVRMPPGEYTVTAIRNDTALDRVVRVQMRGSERIVFRWAQA